MLGIENKYKQFRDLNKILIKPCVDELNKKSDLAVTEPRHFSAPCQGMNQNIPQR
ncbi:hypothetical protein [Escherichia coli]|uniref:hypothetical protein n=1 Tax=Escherichia coli TaxID=562 RepID=UPI003EE1DD98